jgi:hypothetical protein
LICDVPDQPDGWLDLRPQATEPKTRVTATSQWILTVGWPYDTSPLETLAEIRINLPDTIAIAEWASGIFLRMILRADCEATDLAQFISNLLFCLYHLENESAVELALEVE